MNLSLFSIKYSPLLLQESIIMLFLGLLLWEYLLRAKVNDEPAVLKLLLSGYFINQLTRLGVVFESEYMLILFQKLNIICVLIMWYLNALLLIDFRWPNLQTQFRKKLITLGSLPLLALGLLSFIAPDYLGTFHPIDPIKNSFYNLGNTTTLFEGISLFYKMLSTLVVILLLPHIIKKYNSVGLWALLLFQIVHGLSATFIDDMGSEGILATVRIFLLMNTFLLSVFYSKKESVSELIQSPGKQLDKAISKAGNLKLFLAITLLFGNILSLVRFCFQLFFRDTIHYAPHAYTTFSVCILSLLMVVIIRRMTLRLKEKVNALDALNQKLKTSADKEAEANRTKSLFLANISHEIRTPMNGVVGMANLIKSEKNKTLQDTYIDNLIASSDNLMVIINDLLDFSKIEAGKLEIMIKKVHMADIIRPVEEAHSNLARRKGLDFVVDINFDREKQVYTDAVRMQQILHNLYSNAIKFTSRGRIYTKVDLVDEGEKKWIRTEISDTGIGIPANKLDGLFEKFSQIDGSITKNYGGTGLGLSIVKQLTEMLGGSISVKSQDGRGSTFILNMPLIEKGKASKATKKKLNPCSSEKECEHATPMNKLKILVAEDNMINQLIIKKTLEKFNIRPQMVANGQDAVEKAKSEAYDLILMDLQMPKMDGISACKNIMQNAGDKPPVISALTADTNPEDRKRCVDVGMKHFMLKPFKEHDLAVLLHEVKCSQCDIFQKECTV